MKLRDEVLDALMDGPFSLAGLYYSLVRAAAHPRDELRTGEILRASAALINDGSIRAFRVEADGAETPLESEELTQFEHIYDDWFRTADLGELDVDEIGLWLSITEHGRQKWRRNAAPDSRDWRLEYADGTLLIDARTTDHAHAALRWWLTTNEGVSIVGTPRLRSINGFELRDGTRIAPAVELQVTIADFPPRVHA